MKIIFLTAFLFMLTVVLTVFSVAAENTEIYSPDKHIKLKLYLKDSSLRYRVQYKGKIFLEESPLGLVTNYADFSNNLSFVEKRVQEVHKTYYEQKIKKSQVHYHANELVSSYETPDKDRFSITIRVSNNDIAFKYTLERNRDSAFTIVEKETTGFRFPRGTTTFLTPQAAPMSGWKRTKPSYEEEYEADAPLGKKSKYGLGYTFPALFHVGENNWVLLSETGVNGLYCGAKLSDATKEGTHLIAYPDEGENSGTGSAQPRIALPGETPWRTITLGDNLKPIVESTIAFDLVDPLYEPSRHYQFGRSTWSWLIWQDKSINFEDQKTFVDLSSDMGYEFVLVDNWWDTRIGRDKMGELATYARSKNVSLCLWYNSNGFWNDAPQGPKNCMNTAVARKKEMAWLKSIGIKGIKVDFFAGDKQETMQLYEDILADANDYGLFVVFHGCTLPRGWDRMYPNFAGSEAVLASENLVFTQNANDTEAYNATLHPFIRNSVGSMDFGPVLLNKRHDRTNESGRIRKTTAIFQMATSVLFQNVVQHFGITPNNLTDYPKFVIDFMRYVPTEWDETVYIDGYPGKFCILARRRADKWYIVGANAEKETKRITINLPMLADKNVSLYSDRSDRSPQLENRTIDKSGALTVNMQPEGGIIITN